VYVDILFIPSLFITVVAHALVAHVFLLFTMHGQSQYAR